MPLNTARARQLLGKADLRELFIEELGWDRHMATFEVQIDGISRQLQALAQKRGMVAYQCATPDGQAFPTYPERRKVDHHVAKVAHEHLIVFSDFSGATQIWQWVKREPGKPAACREHTFHRTQPGDALLQKLEAIAFTLEEEERLALTDVTRRARAGFDVERVTKRFYDRFQTEHAAFLEFIRGITESTDREWYASVMLNRLMFVYFIQRKGFLDDDRDYLRTRLNRMRAENGQNKFYGFYRYFLLRLFHEGLGGRKRPLELEKLVGRIPYLNGGIFDVHELERADRYGKSIEIPDEAFERIFDYFDQYQWHLDERPLRADNEINPDVLGYIFEKYINQKQMGAYYTREDITEYVSKYTVLPFLLEATRAECNVAFENVNAPTVWDLLRAEPKRYMYPPVQHGADEPLPAEIAGGLKPKTLHRRVGAGPVATVELRRAWNKAAPREHALATETWREAIARRQHYQDVVDKLASGSVCDIDALVTLNLDIRQFVQDVIESCEGPDLLRAFWVAIEGITILDPTCGSGAFLFAALNILEPLYEACLDRMEAFVEDLARLPERRRPEQYSDFRRILDQVGAHPNRRYFIFKSIILNNLFGVDIMEEAVEICKLRLFLKLAAQVEPDASKPNFGIEPLPDVDFNIRAGNSLVGYATYAEVERALGSTFDFDKVASKIAERAADLQVTFDAFRARQVTDGPAVDKQELDRRLKALQGELNGQLAGEYGIKQTNAVAHRKWLKSHQPFHWFAEFYSSVRRGGFDVIIGNPPYLEYSRVTDYRVCGYATAACANLYAYTVERSLVLSASRGRVGMIIPISVACSGAMEPLREHLAESSRSLWLSHYANRPGQLFTGAQNRLTILLASGREAKPRAFSTRYHRWDARNGERDNLLATLRYHEIGTQASMFHGLYPKVGSTLAAGVLAKMNTSRNVHEFTASTGRHQIFWVRVPGYFCQFLLNAPMARPEAGGRERVRGEVNDIAFREKGMRDVVHAVLNSSSYYLFFCTYTDTRHINPSDVMGFPIDLTKYGEDSISELSGLSAKVHRCFGKHTSQVRKSGLLIDSVDAKGCKAILDEIDVALARHYGFSEEELDFVVNYDIKYRMGADLEDEGD